VRAVTRIRGIKGAILAWLCYAESLFLFWACAFQEGVPKRARATVKGARWGRRWHEGALKDGHSSLADWLLKPGVGS